MKLSQIASKPQLIKVIIDDETIINEYGEPLEFWTWDRQPLEQFMKIANTSQTDIPGMIDVVKTLIVDENGKEIITGEEALPSFVLVKVITKVVELLGKS